MRVVFFGTPLFSAEILQTLLLAGIQVVAVVTKPDKPQGRSQKVGVSSVKRFLQEKDLSIPLFQPQKASDPAFLTALEAIPADLFVVVAFGQILPEALLKMPKLDAINVHTSLLPKYRGAAPIQRAIMAGENYTGVCVQKMVKALDAGDVIASAKTAIGEEMTFLELEEALCALSKELLLFVLRSYEKGDIAATPQDEAQVSFAPKVTSEEGQVNWGDPVEKLHNLVRAFAPKPGAWCTLIQKNLPKRLKILKTKKNFSLQGEPGAFFLEQRAVACGSGALELVLVQPEGKRPMAFSEYLRGLQEPPSFI